MREEQKSEIYKEIDGVILRVWCSEDKFVYLILFLELSIELRSSVLHSKLLNSL